MLTPGKELIPPLVAGSETAPARTALERRCAPATSFVVDLKEFAGVRVLPAGGPDGLSRDLFVGLQAPA
jgi:hypothetical protein